MNHPITDKTALLHASRIYCIYYCICTLDSDTLLETCVAPCPIPTRQRSPMLDARCPARDTTGQAPITARLQPPLPTRLRSAQPAASRHLSAIATNILPYRARVLRQRTRRIKRFPCGHGSTVSPEVSGPHASTRRNLMAVDLRCGSELMHARVRPHLLAATPISSHQHALSSSIATSFCDKFLRHDLIVVR
jgi:hypothetical protein